MILCSYDALGLKVPGKEGHGILPTGRLAYFSEPRKSLEAEGRGDAHVSGSVVFICSLYPFRNSEGKKCSM